MIKHGRPTAKFTRYSDVFYRVLMPMKYLNEQLQINRDHFAADITIENGKIVLTIIQRPKAEKE